MDDVTLRLGFGLPVSGRWASPATMARVAAAAEDAGYASLWAFQRLLHPVGADWGPVYRCVHDPLVCLAYVAASTRRIRLGVAVLNVPFYSPVVLAKQLTTLDVLSGGRLDVGLGLGWASEELTAAGAETADRGRRAEEFIACLRAVWGEDPVQFEGRYHQVPAAQIQPKPVQRPHPPLLLGGSAEPALRRAGRLADGWVSASRHDLRRVGDAVSTIRDAARSAGRDPADLRVVVRGVVTLDQPLTARDGSRRPLTGSAEAIRDDLRLLAEQGVTEVFLDPNFDPRVGRPDGDPDEALARAMRLLETFAPGT